MAFLIGGRAYHLPPNPYLIKSDRNARARKRILYARTRTRNARTHTHIVIRIHARATILICIFIKKNKNDIGRTKDLPKPSEKIKLTKMSFITINLLYETLHFSKIYILKRHMPQVIKEKKRVVLTTAKYCNIILCSTICILICNTIHKTHVLQIRKSVLERR